MILRFVWLVTLTSSLIACGQQDVPDSAASEVRNDSASLLEDSKPTRYRGVDELAAALQTRTIESNITTYLGAYLGSHFRSNDNLASLLGYFQGDGLEAGFYNGLPNALNYRLYAALFNSLSKDLVVSTCPVGKPQWMRAHEELKNVLLPLCDWQHAARTREQMMALWLNIMGYRAPMDEFDAWMNLFTSEPLASMPAQELLPLLLESIFMNPYYLFAL